MAQSTRQTNLLVQQDWTKIYQTFTNADFTSYDFETLRNSMINYIKVYYPETFNDFLDSSEYIALIDMIAFLGQSLAFRADLNARENFMDTAQRRDSILKLARMLSYNPKRTTAASGLLKIDSIKTSESIVDSNGINLANATIQWNDLTNDNWLEQFTSVFNAALISTQNIGKPGNSQSIHGVQTDEYSIALNPNTVPVAGFNATIQGTAMAFEAVSATSVGKTYIYEDDPTRAGQFNILYRNDNNGNGSNDTGFFTFFKQGALNGTLFTVQNAIPNNFISVASNNITNDDQWLYAIDVNNNPVTLWSQVPALPGINVIFNNLSEKNLYQVNTTNNDNVNLVFGDGSFANIPQGAFRFYYRTSNGLTYSITPDDLSSVSIAFSYISKKNTVETLTVSASLKYTVTNASSAQSLTSIRSSAPQQYYTQNRMITGEDYNIFPLTSFTSIQKIKAISRTSSGVSLYLDAIDPTGSYSSTNIFGDDGVLTANTSTKTDQFTFLTTNDIYQAIYNKIIPKISSTDMQNYYYSIVDRHDQSTTVTVGNLFVGNTYQIVTPGTTDFVLLGSANNTVGTVFVANTTGNVAAANLVSGKSYTITSVGTANWTAAGAGSNVAGVTFTATTSTTGNGYARQGTGSTITACVFKQVSASTSTSSGYLQVANGNTQQVGTGITGNLKYVTAGALLEFANANTGATSYAAVSSVISNSALETPSLVTFATVVPDGAFLSNATLSGQNCIIPTYKNDLSTALISTIVSQIETKVNFGLRYNISNILGPTWENILPASISAATDWMVKFTYIRGSYLIEYRSIDYLFSSAGSTKFYFDPLARVYSSATGTNITDKIKLLEINTKPNESTALDNAVVWEIYDVITSIDGYVDDTQVLVKAPSSQMENVPDNPDLFTTIADTDASRADLYFQYTHNVPARSRIDPTPVNIIDLYVLTSSYTTDYVNYLRDLTGTVTEPIPPTSSSLETDYGSLDNYKAVSDSIVYNPAKFKPLFGSKAPANLQAKFQVVKNSTVAITDNEIKTQVISAINSYFDPGNWDFGDTFYFSELAAYLHATLAPNISSVIIVPASINQVFGTYFQINADPWEIITSAATVNDVEIVSAITASNLNLGINLVGTF